jgi:hypothetical protein
MRLARESPANRGVFSSLSPVPRRSPRVMEGHIDARLEQDWRTDQPLESVLLRVRIHGKLGTSCNATPVPGRGECGDVHDQALLGSLPLEQAASISNRPFTHSSCPGGTSRGLTHGAGAALSERFRAIGPAQLLWAWPCTPKRGGWFRLGTGARCRPPPAALAGDSLQRKSTCASVFVAPTSVNSVCVLSRNSLNARNSCKRLLNSSN